MQLNAIKFIKGFKYFKIVETKIYVGKLTQKYFIHFSNRKICSFMLISKHCGPYNPHTQILICSNINRKLSKIKKVQTTKLLKFPPFRSIKIYSARFANKISR